MPLTALAIHSNIPTPASHRLSTTSQISHTPISQIFSHRPLKTLSQPLKFLALLIGCLVPYSQMCRSPTTTPTSLHGPIHYFHTHSSTHRRQAASPPDLPSSPTPASHRPSINLSNILAQPLKSLTSTNLRRVLRVLPGNCGWGIALTHQISFDYYSG